MGLHDCGGPHPPLLQCIHREPGAGHAGEWVRCSAGDVHIHACAHSHTVGLPLLQTHLSPPSGERQGCAIVLEPYLHHTLQASFGEDAVKTEEEILTCNAKCRDTVCHHLYTWDWNYIQSVCCHYTYDLHYDCSYIGRYHILSLFVQCCHQTQHLGVWSK